MAYKDYISTTTLDANDPTNPFWYQPLQYIPFEYKGINVDSKLALLKPQEKPQMPDLSKFREKLDKDLLPDEKKGIMQRFNDLEREIRMELQVNPYALSNNPYLIQKFNELANLYNSAELQSLIDNKKFVKEQLDKAVSSGETDKLVYDPQLKQYSYQTIGQVANGVLNLQGDQKSAHVVFDFDYGKGKFKNISIPNIGNGREEDFTRVLAERYSKVEADTSGDNTKIASLHYVDAFGNKTSPAYAEGYIKVVSGGGYKTSQNYNNLLAVSAMLINQKDSIKTILGDKAYEGFNQLVHKTLAGGDALSQYKNLERVYKQIEQNYKQLKDAKGNDPIKENQYKSLYEQKMKPIIEEIEKDEMLTKALSSVSIQKIMYDIATINSNKSSHAKNITIKNNPVLQYLLALSNGSDEERELARKYFSYIQQLNTIAKSTTEDAVLANNTAFNTLLNRKYDHTTETYHDISLHGHAYGGGIEREKEYRSTPFQNLVFGLYPENLKEKTIGADEYIQHIMQSTGASREQAIFVAAQDAAASDLLRHNALFKYYVDYERETDSAKKQKLKEIIEREFEKEIKNTTLISTSKLGIKPKVEDLGRLFKQRLEEETKKNIEALNSGKQREGQFNYLVRYTVETPTNTRGGNEGKWVPYSQNGEELVRIGSVPTEEKHTIYVNGLPVDSKKYPDALITNGVNYALGTQLNSYTFGGPLNNTNLNRTLYIPRSEASEFIRKYGLDKSSVKYTEIGGKEYLIVDNAQTTVTQGQKGNFSHITPSSSRNQTTEETYTGEFVNPKPTLELQGTNRFRKDLEEYFSKDNNSK